jgi:hypothetical protein
MTRVSVQSQQSSDVDSNGGLLKTRIDNFGVGYSISPIPTFDSAFGSGASISTTLGTLCTYPGYYSSNDGRLSTNKVMQDNHYYQNFSYVLLTEVVIDRYKDILTPHHSPRRHGYVR